MPVWILLELRLLEGLAKVLHVAVQVADGKDIAGLLKKHEPPFPSGCGAEGPDGLLQRSLETDWIGHGLGLRGIYLFWFVRHAPFHSSGNRENLTGHVAGKSA